MELEQLAKTETMILSGYLFRSKPQMKRLLRYLIKHTIENNKQALQQRTIAVACLGRDEHFDSSKDPIVRIEAARLRKLLDRFYEQPNGTPPPYRISLPKGSYQLSFSRNLENKVSKGPSVLLICQTPQSASEKSLRLMMRVRRDLSTRLAAFRHIELMVDFSPMGQVAERGAIHFLAEEQHDYVVRMEVVEDCLSGGYLLSTIAVHRVTQEILWSQSTAFPGEYHENDLAAFYKRLINPLVADAYGLLGKHWSDTQLAKGIEYVPDHLVAYVYYFAICNEPTLERCQQYLDFLEGRLERQPADFVAKAGYLSLGFIDYFQDYQLIKDDYEVRLQHALEVSKYYPGDSGAAVLTGFCYFLQGNYPEAKLYLEAAQVLNQDNGMWGFIQGCLLYFMGEKQQGLARIQSLQQYNRPSPSYYAVPQFFHHLEKDEFEAAYLCGSQIFCADNLGHIVRALAYLVVGDERQASLEYAKVSRQSANADWLKDRVLSHSPVLVKKVSMLLTHLKALSLSGAPSND